MASLHDRHLRKKATFRPSLEWLEDRHAPAGVWLPQGPSPIQNGQIEGMGPQQNPVIGAVQAIAPHPTNADILFIGTVNGGIWGTTSGTSLTPTWTLLTEGLPTQAIGDLRFSPLDSQTLYAGTGSFSNGSLPLTFSVTRSSGGPSQGVLLTTDGGTSWTVLGTAVFGDRTIRNIVPTALTTTPATPAVGQTVLAGTFNPSDPQRTHDGLYRSTNGGTTWARISGTGVGLPDGGIGDIVLDPADATGMRMYASVAGQGIFRSVDGGANWVNVPTGIDASDLTNSGNIRLSIHNSAGNNVLYAAIVDASSGRLLNVYRTADQGGNWTKLPFPKNSEDVSIITEGQGNNNLSVLADLTNPNVVFIGGDAQNDPNGWPNANGCTDFVGNHARFNGTTWDFLECTNTNFTAPHADSRDMEWAADGHLLESDDGGLFRLLHPNSVGNNATWVAANGNLQVTELYQVAYDSLNNVILGAAQDVGAFRQITAGGTAYATADEGDGYQVVVDNSSPTQSVSYFGDDGGIQRQVFNAANQLVSNVSLPMTGIPDALLGNEYLFELNAVNPAQGYVAGYRKVSGSDVYELYGGSAISGDNYQLLHTFGDTVNALVPGGQLNGQAVPGVIWAGLDDGTLHLSTNGGTTFNQLASFTSDQVLAIATDPDNWEQAYVVSFHNQTYKVSMTSNGGQSFQEITGNLGQLATDVFTLQLINLSPVPGDEVVLVGGFGGVFVAPAVAGAGTTWFELGIGLPDVVASDLYYDAADDVLAVGTYGRGAWLLPEAMTYVNRSRVDHLAFAQQPGNTSVGVPVPAFSVQAFDEFNQLVTGASVPVTLSLATNPSGASLGGATALTVNGVATFAGVTVSRRGAGFQLAATAPGTAAVFSNVFNVTAPVPTLTTLVQRRACVGRLRVSRFQVRVTSTDGVPRGRVTLLDNGRPLGTFVLHDGVLRFTTQLRRGLHQIRAVYGGNATFDGSAALPLNLVIRSLVCR